LLVSDGNRDVQGDLSDGSRPIFIFSSERLNSGSRSRDYGSNDGSRSRDYGSNDGKGERSFSIDRVKGEKLIGVVIATALINNVSLRVSSTFVGSLVNKLEVHSIDCGHSEVLSGGTIDGPVPVVVSIMSSLSSKIEDEGSIV